MIQLVPKPYQEAVSADVRGGSSEIGDSSEFASHSISGDTSRAIGEPPESLLETTRVIGKLERAERARKRKH